MRATPLLERKQKIGGLDSGIPQASLQEASIVTEYADPSSAEISVPPFKAGASNQSKLRYWCGRLGSFFVGQGLVQFLNLLTGFLLIRWLSVDDYAAYTLINGFQSTVGIIAELGLASSVLALLKGRTEPIVVGVYVHSARFYRNRLFLFLIPVVVVTFSVLTRRQGWSAAQTLLLMCAVLASIYAQSSIGYNSIPLLIRNELNAYYKVPVLLGVCRFVLNIPLHFWALLNSISSTWVSTLCAIAQTWMYRRQSAIHLVEPIAASPETNREIRSYIRPLIPSTVFFALQGQISVLLISWFGRSGSIAEVGALGRLGQFFVMLGALNSVIVAPSIARIPRSLLRVRYLQVFAGASAVSFVLLLVSVYVPQSVLWILGDKYTHLKSELGWMMASSCTGYLVGVMWTMHSARNWIFRWGGWLYVFAVLSTQIVGLLTMDLGSTRGVILLSLYSTTSALLVQIFWAIYGFASDTTDTK